MLNYASAIEPRAIGSAFETFHQFPVDDVRKRAVRRIRWRYPVAVVRLAVLLSDILGARETSIALALPLSSVYRWIAARPDDRDSISKPARGDDLAATLRALVVSCTDQGFDIAPSVLDRWMNTAASKIQVRLTCVSAFRQSLPTRIEAAPRATGEPFATMSETLPKPRTVPSFTTRPSVAFTGVDRAKRAMEQTCCDPWSARQLAAIAGFSRFTFARKFASAFGISPHQYLLSLRVRRAYRLLESSERNLDKVAVAAGFGSASSMHRAFKRFLGASPAQVFYRRVRSQPTHVLGESSMESQAHGVVDSLVL